MPIRLNLLAEAQAAEEMRRRDPVKRAIWAASFVVLLVLGYYGWLLASDLNKGKELKRYQGLYAPLEKAEKEIKAQRGQTGDVERKLAQLSQVATNRFLWGPVLNVFTEVIVEDVQLVNLRAEQSYDVDVPVAPPGTKTPPKTPPSSTERISMLVEARNYNPESPNQIRYRDALAAHPLIKSFFTNTKDEDGAGVNLKGALTPAIPDSDNRVYRQFRVQVTLPPRVRK